jgi:hypothetical protein
VDVNQLEFAIIRRLLTAWNLIWFACMITQNRPPRIAAVLAGRSEHWSLAGHYVNLRLPNRLIAD